MKNITRYLPVVIFALVLFTLAFLIPCHSEWCLSDDYLVYGRTGLGHPFLPSYQFAPQLGRFFPTAYLPYNILLLFHSGFIPAYDHYLFLSILFVLAFIVIYYLLELIVKDICGTQTLISECIVLFALLILMQRSLEGFMTLFSTFGISCLLFSLFLLVFYIFTKRKSTLSIIVLSLLSLWLTFASEANFVIPFSLCCCSLIFNRNSLSKKEKTGYYCLLSISILYLLLYFLLIFIHTTNRYDSSHGSEYTFFENTIIMIRSAKVFWLAIPLFFYRIISIIKKKDTYEPFYDAILFSGLAMLAGNLVLKLNMTLYYVIPSMFCIPSIIHFTLTCSRRIIPVSILCFLAVFYIIKIPGTVSKQYAMREHDANIIEELLHYEERGYELVWADINSNVWAYLVFNDYFRFKKGNYYYELPDLNSKNRLSEKSIVISNKRIEEQEEFKNVIGHIGSNVKIVHIDRPEFNHPFDFSFYEMTCQ